MENLETVRHIPDFLSDPAERMFSNFAVALASLDDIKVDAF
jgi:hypothetical protein